MPLEVQKGSREICFEMKGGFPSGLRKVLLLRVVPLLLLLVENHGAIATTRAAAAVATYNNGGDGDDDHPVVAPRRNHRKLENRPSTEVIPNAYIILLNDNVTATPEAIAKEYGITVEHAFKHAIKGFSSRYVEAAILDLLLEDSRIWAVGEDGNLEMEHEGPHEVVQQKEEEEAEEGGDDGGGEVVHMQQVAAPGQHLDQIDQSMDGMYSYTYTGAGVHIYVVDAGILASHADFGGRVVTPCFNDIGPCNTDTDSHGTHIASIAGTFGSFFYSLLLILLLDGYRLLMLLIKSISFFPRFSLPFLLSRRIGLWCCQGCDNSRHARLRRQWDCIVVWTHEWTGLYCR
jgi:hypothetical protein